MRGIISGAPLDCRSYTTTGDTQCSVQAVYQSPRRQDNYKNIGTGPSGRPFFQLKFQDAQLRLLVDMGSLSPFYRTLESRRLESAASSNAQEGVIGRQGFLVNAKQSQSSRQRRRRKKTVMEREREKLARRNARKNGTYPSVFYNPCPAVSCVGNVQSGVVCMEAREVAHPHLTHACQPLFHDALSK